MGGYDTLDAYTPLGAVLTLGGVAIMLPAVILGNRIVKARPASSISSSRGGFDFAVFFKCFAAGLALIALPLIIVNLLTSENTGAVRFTVFGFILCTVLVPLQCIAEEYFFRGQLMTMFGAWIKFPIIPIVLQTVFFAAAHPYNVIGVISVAVMGMILGVCAYITKGLEASCALHIINNMIAFYFAGFGFSGITSEVQIGDLIADIIICGLYLAFIIFADKKLGWFNRVKRDDAAEACGTFFEGNPLQFFQHPPAICGRIFVFSRVPRRVDAGRAAEGVDFEAGIVGEAVGLEMVPDGAGFLDRVAPQGVAGFGKVAAEAAGSGRDDLERRPQNGLGLFQFVGVVGSEENLHGSGFGHSKIRIKLLLLRVICSIR